VPPLSSPSWTPEGNPPWKPALPGLRSPAVAGFACEQLKEPGARDTFLLMTTNILPVHDFATREEAMEALVLRPLGGFEGLPEAMVDEYFDTNMMLTMVADDLSYIGGGYRPKPMDEATYRERAEIAAYTPFGDLLNH